MKALAVTCAVVATLGACADGIAMSSETTPAEPDAVTRTATPEEREAISQLTPEQLGEILSQPPMTFPDPHTDLSPENVPIGPSITGPGTSPGEESPPAPEGPRGSTTTTAAPPAGG